jgi:flagellar FliL protein
MPEQPGSAAAPAPAVRKGAALPIAIAALASLAAGAGGAWFLLRPPAAPAPAGHAAAAAGEPGAAKEPALSPSASFAQRLLPLEPFVVNVNGDGYTRYLKLVLSLEASTPEVKQELAARAPQIRDAVIAVLTSKRLEDISDFEGKALLKEDLQKRVNDLLSGGAVQSVLFTEFVVQ